MGEKSTITTDCTWQENTPVFCDSISNQRCIQRFLSIIHPNELPPQIADCKRVVMLYAESSRIVEGTVPHHDDHRNTQRRSHRQSFHGVHPAHTAAAAEYACAAGRRMLHDFKLRVLSLRHDVF